METTINSFWQRNKIIFKGLLIGILILLLLIPTVMLEDLVDERQNRQQQAIAEVSSKWAGHQVISGPVIAVPYWQVVKDYQGTVTRVKHQSYFLPDKLSINANVVPEKRYRGIYQVMVYTSDLQVSGSFSEFKFAELKIPAEDMLWQEAVVYLNVNDVRGLKEEIALQWGDKKAELVPGKFADEQFKESLSAALPLDDTAKTNGFNFRLDLKLKGSQSLLFVPLGKKTNVALQSTWPDPSFTGNYLPDDRQIKDTGFTANWNILSLNRAYPQQWANRAYDLNASAFGVELEVPVDAYQKSFRSVRYGILCIVLTFTAFFLIELIYKRSLHPLQYVLVGFALCIFYSLLLSISEYLGFNPAYIIAALATVLLVAWYVSASLKSRSIAFFISLLLVAMYGFIYILIQSQDYALLMGSIGLFVALGLVMYFSRRVKWS